MRCFGYLDGRAIVGPDLLFDGNLLRNLSLFLALHIAINLTSSRFERHKSHSVGLHFRMASYLLMNVTNSIRYKRRRIWYINDTDLGLSLWSSGRQGWLP